jgi:dihydrofolate synthase/folylpolyglutamate synthase
LEYLETLQGKGIVPGLDSIRELCLRLGNPQDGLQFVHIAGTNGKGSVLAFVSTIVKSAGYRVGRYFSPAISDVKEVIQVNGRAISQADFCEGLELVKGCCDAMESEGMPHPTVFEVQTALALWYFWKKHCDLVVLEVGMGGKDDATNLITSVLVSVLVSISADHMGYLGNSLEQIAEQKTGIIKEGCTVVSATQKEKVMEIICNKAVSLECPMTVADASMVAHVKHGVEKQRFDYKQWKKLEITMAGRYQVENAVIALEVIAALQEKGYVISEKALRKGLLETAWPGRFSILGKQPLFVADGAHNEDGAKKLADSIDFYFTNKRIIYIMGVLKDKEYDKIIALTHNYADQIITVTPPENPRALHAYELAGEIVKTHPSVTAVDSLEEAVEMSYLLAGKDDVIIAFGSLSYMGRLMRIVEKRNSRKGRTEW